MEIILEMPRLAFNSPQLFEIEHLLQLSLFPDAEITEQILLDKKEQLQHEIKVILSAKEFACFYDVVNKKTGECIGQAGLLRIKHSNELYVNLIACNIKAAFQGNNFNNEVTQALIKWGFSYNPAQQSVAMVGYRDHEMHCFRMYQNDIVELADYNEKWPAMANAEIQELSRLLAFPNVIEILHVGSTSIPGMMTKPVIDILIVANELSMIKKSIIDILTSNGYILVKRNLPFWLLFLKGSPQFGEVRTHHIHVTQIYTENYYKMKLFAPYLRDNPKEANEYLSLKKSLANDFKYDRKKYAKFKDDLVNRIINSAIEKAGLNKIEI